MKFILTTLLLIFIPIYGNGQTVDSLNHEIHLLELEMNRVNQKIDSLKSHNLDIGKAISKKREQINTIQVQNQSGKRVATKIDFLGGQLRDTPSVNGHIIAELNSDDEILIYDWFQEPYFKASYKGTIGYISYSSLVENEFIKSILDETKEDHFQELEMKNPKLARLLKKYGKSIAERLIKKEIWIGMSSAMVKDGLGQPNDINRSTYSWGVHEQWVYPKGRYLYFEDGILKSWQESN